MANNHSEIEKRLWASADELRANSKLKSSEYSVPVLGLIFLRYADFKFAIVEKELAGKGSGRRAIGKEDYQAKGVMYLPPQARFSKLLDLPEGENIGKAINDAMKAVEAENEDLRGVLPKTYNKIESSTLVSLLKTFSQIAVDAEGDTFGKIYEYFLGNFARAEGAKGGEFFTPTSIVKLIVEIIEPYHGRIFDPACGSGALGEGLTLIRCGWHFDGGTALHWAGGAGGRGALLTGDIIQVVPDRKHVSFMYSYPNFIPLPASAIERIIKAVESFEYDRVYGAFWDMVIEADGKAAVKQSAERYLRSMDYWKRH